MFQYDNSGRRVRKMQCTTETGCGSWPSSTAQVDRLYVDDDYEIDLKALKTYKHVFVGGRRVVTAEYGGRGRGKPAPAP